ncbi:hypothetical protein [Altererythrobacter sp. MTPC7]|uniref:hypothetical protein n=1 Tax=Altererythrobacter sp. MTPC7 TaxID=3056567 RepID=UPI0036F23668
MSAEDAFGANLTPTPSDIELVSVFLCRDPAALEAHDQHIPIGPGRYHYVVFLFFRDSHGNLSRIRTWCEFIVVGRLGKLQTLDEMAIRETRDLMRNGIMKNAKRLETLWDGGDDRGAKTLDEDRTTGTEFGKVVSENEFCFDHGYWSAQYERQRADRIYTCRPLTAVFWRGPNELWATASAVQDFRPDTAACDRNRAASQRSMQLFRVAASLCVEEMITHISEQPAGSTEVTFQL